MAIILNVSMPSCCNNCPCFMGNDGYSYCNATDDGKNIGDDFNVKRPDWCPIQGELYLSSVIKSHDCCLWNKIENKCDVGLDSGINGCPDDDRCYMFD